MYLTYIPEMKGNLYVQKKIIFGTLVFYFQFHITTATITLCFLDELYNKLP